MLYGFLIVIFSDIRRKQPKTQIKQKKSNQTQAKEIETKNSPV